MSIPPLHPCNLPTDLTCHYTSLPHLCAFATFLPTWPVIIRLYPTCLPLPPSYQLDLLSYISIRPFYPCYLLTNLTCYHTFLSHLPTLATFLPTWPVIICFYPTSLPLPPSYQLDLLSYVSIPPLHPCHLLTNLTCYHTFLYHLSTLATFLPPWPVIIRFYPTSLPLPPSHKTWPVTIRLYPTSLPLPPSYHLNLLSYVSIPPLYPCYLLTNLTCYHTFLFHLPILATFLPPWPIIIRSYPTSPPLPPSFQLDLLSYVSIHLPTLATFLPIWSVIIRFYPDSLPLPPSYQLDLLSYVLSASLPLPPSYQLDLLAYVSIPPLYPCHLLTNLTCYHTSLSHLSTLATFLPPWPVIIVSIHLSTLAPSYQLDLLSYISIPPPYPCHLFTNLTCYHTSLSHLSTLATFLPPWPIIIRFYTTSLPLPPSYQLDLLSNVSITPLYLRHLLTSLICHHMCQSHLSTIATTSSTWFVIIHVYPTSLPLPPAYQLDLSSYVSIPPLHQCRLLINLICNRTCLYHLSTLATFLPTWPINILLYTTPVPLPPSHQRDMLSYVYITPLYPCHLFTNLTCYHTSLSHLSTIATFSPTWPVIIRFYPTSLPLPPSYQFDLFSYISIPPLYPCHLLTTLTCYHTFLSHLSTLATFLPTWPVIIRLYLTSLALPPY